MVYLWFVILAVILLLVIRFSRPLNYYDEPVRSRGRYIILNTMMGNPALSGQTFRTQWGAARAYRKLGNPFGIDMFEIRKLV